MSEAYGPFALAYDAALGRRFFDAVRPLLAGILQRHPTSKHTHLDLACGTGLATEWFRDSGWHSTGLDASLPMLGRAHGRRVAGDLRSLPFRSRFARITCLYDSLNHLLELDELTAAFEEVRAVMDGDSLFLFDVNHPEIYPEIWGEDEPFVASGDDFRLEIATSYRARERLGVAEVSGWARVGGERVAIQERHRQRAWTEQQVVGALARAGLAPVEVMPFDPYGESGAITAPSVKIFFVVQVK